MKNVFFKIIAVAALAFGLATPALAGPGDYDHVYGRDGYDRNTDDRRYNNGRYNTQGGLSWGDVPKVAAITAVGELFQGLREGRNIAKSRDASIAITRARTEGEIAVVRAKGEEAKSFWLLQWNTQNGGGAPSGAGTSPRTDLNNCLRDTDNTVRCAVSQ